MKGNLIRSVKERMEEYDRARARIFSTSRIPDSTNISFMVLVIFFFSSCILVKLSNYFSTLEKLLFC